MTRPRATLAALCMILVGAGAAGAVAPAAGAPYARALADDAMTRMLDGVAWRNVGPFRAGGWISAIAVPEQPAKAHRNIMYVGSRTGGLFRTTNNGTTFEAVFDHAPYLAIGAVAVAPSDASVVWVGTGGNEAARSTYRGDGVHRSLDGGDTWEHVGLEDTHHIARIVIHPRDPDVVWVAAMGHLFSGNEERGVFKTIDGGRTWSKVLYVNEHIGAVDLVIDPGNPQVLYAAAYEMYRYPWHLEEGGPGSGIHKSEDGGATWSRLENGLPTGKIGRIGLDVYRRDGRIVYAAIENANPRTPTDEEIAAAAERGVPLRDRVIGGEVYRSDDAGATWTKMNRPQDDVGGKAAYSFMQIRVDPNDDQHILVNSDTLPNSEDGGRTWFDLSWPAGHMFPDMFGDVRTMWFDPEDSDHIVLGTDGGVHITWDGGRTSDHLHNLPLGEIYALGLDNEQPYNMYVGLQDHEMWKGPSRDWSGRISLEDWITVGTGDGMYNVVDPVDSRWLYNTSQFGDHMRVDQVQRTRTSIEPQRPEGEDPYRFTWNTPLHLSPHDPATLYTGAQVLLRSPDRGDTWEEISPDLTRNDAVKIAGRGNIMYCTITTISESPVTPGVIWIGTDDGRVWSTPDAGATWVEHTAALAALGAPEERWVSRVAASPHDAGTAYVTRNGRRHDDPAPYVFRTRDGGATWESIDAGLPPQPVNVIAEDPDVRDLLWLGNDHGAYLSYDAGGSWYRLQGDMPNVPVHDLAVHPRERELVLGTYGRGVWIADVAPLQQLRPEFLQRQLHAFEPGPARLFPTSGWGNYELYGNRVIATPNPPDGLVLSFWSAGEAAEPGSLTIRDDAGMVHATLEVPATAGWNRVRWNLRDDDREPVPAGPYRARLQLHGVAVEVSVIVSS